MIDYLFYLLLGSAAGAIIAGLGLGLVVTFQSSGVVNFATGAMAMWVAFVYADLRRGEYPLPFPGLPPRLHLGDDVGLPVALALALLTAVVFGAVIHALVFRPLRRSSAIANIVASVGVLIVLTALVERRFAGESSIRVRPILPRQPVTLADGLTIPRDGLWLAAIVAGLATVLAFVSRHTRVGRLTRAAADNEKAAVLLGSSPNLLAAGGFVVSSLVVGCVGVLAAPMIQLDSGVYTFGFLVPALGAALLGRFRNIWATAAAGLAIGMVQSTFTKLQGDLSWFPKYGARDGLPFLVIIVAMAVSGEALPSRSSAAAERLAPVPPSRVSVTRVVVPLGLAIIGLLTLGPLWRAAIMTSTIAAILALSFVVLSGFGGQTSLAQLSLAGVAGFALSRLATHWHIPFPLAPLLAALVASLFGVVVGLPALRVRGTNLAILTLAGGVAITEFVFKNPDLVGDGTNGAATVPHPKLGGWDLALVLGDESSRPIFGIFLVVVLAAVALAVANLRSSSTGRRILAVRSNERAASALGINVALVKALVFAMSGFIAGLGGCLIAYRFGSISEVSFGVVASLVALTTAYLGGITSVSGAMTSGLLAASGVVFYALERLSGPAGEWQLLIGGLMLIVVVVNFPAGLSQVVGSAVSRRLPRKLFGR